ncbi:unnamed protein product [Mytilus coruscus]|uniref:Farnesoic acid O-methyl transferase domain-containing protein n=1 Tax=Mytilus coruscus TaxID=42192 RepID=A0A6J8EW69_MYTCO|nr:unnamed protein product [Mytilus coruscus]
MDVLVHEGRTVFENSPSCSTQTVLSSTSIPATELLENVTILANAALAPSTQATYSRAWKTFDSFCTEIMNQSLQPPIAHNVRGMPKTISFSHGTAMESAVVAMVEYLKVRPYSVPTEPLFCSVDATPLHRPDFDRILHKCLASCGLDSSRYKGHSFRIGAATDAAERGLSDSQIRSMGPLGYFCLYTEARVYMEVFMTTLATSLSCPLMCHQRKNCMGFNFNINTSVCELISTGTKMAPDTDPGVSASLLSEIWIHTPNTGNGLYYVPNASELSHPLNQYGFDTSYKHSITFDLKVCSDAFVYLSASQVMDSNTAVYEICIEGGGGTKVLLRRKDYIFESIASNVLGAGRTYCGSFQPFWISWQNGNIKIGKGLSVDSEVVIDWNDTNPFNIHGVGVRTGQGQSGQWIIYTEGKLTLMIYFV